MAGSTTKSTSSAASQRDTSSKMAAEAAPAEPPKGAPTLRSLASVPRRKRADFFDALKRLPVNEDGEFTLLDDLSVPAMEKNAAMMNMVADIEQACGVLAIDPDAYDEWASSCSDEDLMQLFSYAFTTMQAGEAGASQN